MGIITIVFKPSYMQIEADLHFSVKNDPPAFDVKKFSKKFLKNLSGLVGGPCGRTWERVSHTTSAESPAKFFRKSVDHHSMCVWVEEYEVKKIIIKFILI